MQQPPPTDELLHLLRVFATNVHAALADPQTPWLWRSEPDGWSLTQVVCHLRDVEQEVHQPRFRAVLTEENAFLAGATPDEWAVPRAYQTQSGSAALKAFIAARQDTIAILEPLTPHQWLRQGRHAFFGPTTLHEMVNLVVRHDDAHWTQIVDLLASAPRPR